MAQRPWSGVTLLVGTCFLVLLFSVFSGSDARAEGIGSRQLPNLISCYGVSPTPDGRLIFTTSDNGVIGVFDAAEGRYLQAIDLRDRGVWPTGGVVAAGKLYVESFTNVIVIDVETLEVVTEIPQNRFLGTHFGDVVATADGSSVYAISGATTHLSRIDTESDTVAADVEVGGNFTGIGLSRDESRVYITGKKEPRLVVVDTETMEIVLDSTFGNEEDGFLEIPTEVATSSDGRVYVSYVAADFLGRVAVLDSDGTLLETWKAQAYSTGVDVTGDGEFVVLGNGEVFAAQFGESVAAFEFPVGLSSAAVSPTGGTVYITNINTQFLYVVEGFEELLRFTSETDAEGSLVLGSQIVLDLVAPGDPERMFQLLASTGVSESVV